ncbi:unnamed protein product [Ambrosiozyma monospora]|uniref:Unnamed protein product n=1 Tax=Ambrosiozyma monospora TaxID=43982 RepID=A0ACB5UE69_AMBMO|nr:unnamed protein product [Ambrosiozyma monospora]
MNLDFFMFDEFRLSSYVTLLLLFTTAYLIWLQFYRIDYDLNMPFFENTKLDITTIDDIDTNTTNWDLEAGSNANNNTHNKSSRPNSSNSGRSSPSPSTPSTSSASATATQSSRKILYLPKNSKPYAIPLLWALSWPGSPTFSSTSVVHYSPPSTSTCSKHKVH